MIGTTSEGLLTSQEHAEHDRQWHTGVATRGHQWQDVGLDAIQNECASRLGLADFSIAANLMPRGNYVGFRRDPPERKFALRQHRGRAFAGPVVNY